jgi:hypothetical protein
MSLKHIRKISTMLNIVNDFKEVNPFNTFVANFKKFNLL